MQKGILIVVFTLLTLLIVGIFLGLINYAKGIPTISDSNVQVQSKVSTEKMNSKQWAEKMAKINRTDFQTPVNELYINISFKKREVAKKRMLYEIDFKKANDYSLFCIMQTLNEFSLPYVVVRDEKESFIRIDSNNTIEIKRFVDKLEQYDINSNLKEIWL